MNKPIDPEYDVDESILGKLATNIFVVIPWSLFFLFIALCIFSFGPAAWIVVGAIAWYYHSESK